MGEAFQPGSARPHTNEQGMVDEPIGNNRAMAIDQCHHSSDVGLESTREKEHSVPAQPACQLFFKRNMDGAGSRHQPRAAGTQAIRAKSPGSSIQYVGMAAQSQVVIAGQVAKTVRCRSTAPELPVFRSGLQTAQRSQSGRIDVLLGISGHAVSLIKLGVSEIQE